MVPTPTHGLAATAGKVQAGESAAATPADVLAAMPDFALGATFLVAWVQPTALGARVIPVLLLTMLLEFIIIHSAAFMGNVLIADADRATKAKRILALCLFYTLFVAGFALGFEVWWPLLAFWGLTLNRLLGVLVGGAPHGSERQYVQYGWAMGAIWYLTFCTVTTLLPVPALGITPAIIATQHIPSSGLWVDEPWRAVAFGFLYFTAVGYSQLRARAWMHKVPAPTNQSR